MKTRSMEVRAAVLEDAKRIVLGDRDEQYGAPEHSFSRIAAKWNVTLARKLKQSVTAADVAIMMIDLKTVRLSDNVGHRDSWIDTAGYAACGAACVDDDEQS